MGRRAPGQHRGRGAHPRLPAARRAARRDRAADPRARLPAGGRAPRPGRRALRRPRRRRAVAPAGAGGRAARRGAGPVARAGVRRVRLRGLRAPGGRPPGGAAPDPPRTASTPRWRWGTATTRSGGWRRWWPRRRCASGRTASSCSPSTGPAARPTPCAPTGSTATAWTTSWASNPPRRCGASRPTCSGAIRRSTGPRRRRGATCRPACRAWWGGTRRWRGWSPPCAARGS